MDGTEKSFHALNLDWCRFCSRQTFEVMLSFDSANMYMLIGGTNFGLMNGAGDKIGKRKTIKTAVWILIGLAAAFSALTPAMIAFLPKVFDVSSVAEEMMKEGLKIYALSYVLKAAVKFICAYCYSVRQKVTSDILTYLDPVVFTPLLLFVLSSVAELNGVRWSVVCAQAAVCVAAAVIFAVRKKCKNVGKP